ncbi:MAG TPA: hypothetical protein VHD56_17480 [Tepidisphaeraceae bacterium]|jgi:hypothetical protein|nr:hypothetical protein [Tepidisphaeraceae bacterium]
MTQKVKTKPTHEIRIGTVKAAIWSRTNEHGRTRYDVTVCRIFKRKDEKGWQYTDSFGVEELLTLAKVVDLAHSRIAELSQSNVKAA